MKNNFIEICLIVILSLSVFSLSTTAESHLNQVPSELKLGGLFPLSGSLSEGGVEQEAAFRLAINEINLDNSILPNTELTFVVRDTESDTSEGTKEAEEMLDRGVFGIVGAASSDVSKAVALKVKDAEIPQISYFSTDEDLSNKDTYPYFLRVIPPASDQGITLARVLNSYGIVDVVTLATSDNYGLAGISAFETEARGLNMTIVSEVRFDPDSSDVSNQLQSIYNSGVKTIVLHVNGEDARTVFSQAMDGGISATEGYNWFVTDKTLIALEDKSYDTVVNGLLATSHGKGQGVRFKDFLDIWECGSPNDFAGSGNRNPDIFTTYVYDAVYAFALAAHAMIETGNDPLNGADLLEELQNLIFTGSTGSVSFDSNQDRIGFYNLINLQNSVLTEIGSYDLTSGLIQHGDIKLGNGTVIDGSSTLAPDYSNDILDCDNFEEDIYKIEQDAPGFSLTLTLIGTIALATLIRRKR
ncbi:MAG: ABC transporter substrate-binding protein [Candidatus Kariarchaeaceae archaeon]|jgi:ABC-type branched-subunit amino acid transport system substrate-binding protein